MIATEKQCEKFNKLIRDGLEEMGIKLSGFNDAIVDTTAGAMRIHLPKDHYRLWTVFTQFTDPIISEEAKRLGANVHSGKWNFHISSNQPMGAFLEDAAERILTSIREILPPTTAVEMDREGIKDLIVKALEDHGHKRDQAYEYACNVADELGLD